MNRTVTFEVDQIGMFTARAELPMVEEQQVESELDLLLDGRHAQLLSRVRELYREERDEARAEAEEILRQIDTCRAIITMERLLLTRPDSVGPMQEITAQELFERIQKAYHSALGDAGARRRSAILNYLTDLAAADSDPDARERAAAFETSELGRKRNDLLFWFRKKYGLAMTDYRVRDLTRSQALEEYMEDILQTRARGAQPVPNRGREPATQDDGFRSCAARVKQDPSFFEQWARGMEKKVAKQLGKTEGGEQSPASAT